MFNRQNRHIYIYVCINPIFIDKSGKRNCRLKNEPKLKFVYICRIALICFCLNRKLVYQTGSQNVWRENVAISRDVYI